MTRKLDIAGAAATLAARIAEAKQAFRAALVDGADTRPAREILVELDHESAAIAAADAAEHADADRQVAAELDAAARALADGEIAGLHDVPAGLQPHAAPVA